MVHQDEFQYVLYYVAKICKNANGKVLIYIGVNSSIQYVKDWLCFNFPELRTKIGVYTSVVTENKKSMLDKKIILSTTKSCGAAMDIKGLKITILLAEPFKSEVLARQTLGRTRDDDTLYIEFVDVAFYQITKFYNYKLPVFKKYAKSTTDMTMAHHQLVDAYNKICQEQQVMTQPLEFMEQGELTSPFIRSDKLVSPLIRIPE